MGVEGIEVRRAAVCDLAQVLEIEQATLNLSHWSEADYRKYEQRRRDDLFHRCLMVAVRGQRVTGFVAGTFLEGEDAAMVENLAVASSWRRRGVARKLLAGMMEWAQSEGAVALQLEVRLSNAAAQALYRSLGFREQGRRVRYYSNPEEDGVLMELRLEKVPKPKDL